MATMGENMELRLDNAGLNDMNVVFPDRCPRRENLEREGA